ncbi:hypothetical protein ABIA65_004133 [Mycolicibacterium sp. 624]
MPLPEPLNWRDSWHRLAWLSLGTVAFVAWFVYVAGRAAVRGDYLTAVGVGAFVGCPIVLVGMLGYVAGGWTSLRARRDATGTKLVADKIFEWCGYLGFALFIVGGAVLAIFIPRGTIDLDVSRGWQLATPIVLVPAVVFAVRGLLTAYKRGGVGYVKLTPAGLDIANILSNDIVEWDDIVKMVDHSEEKKTRKAAVLSLRDGSERIIDGLDFYVPRGVGLYWMIRHYWLHPDERTELVDGRALERLKAGRFDVETGDARA